MEWEHNNLNGDIILARNLNFGKKIIWFSKIGFRNESYNLFFQEDTLTNCLKNKIVQNFHTTNPNEMNQSFSCR